MTKLSTRLEIDRRMQSTLDGVIHGNHQRSLDVAFENQRTQS